MRCFFLLFVMLISTVSEAGDVGNGGLLVKVDGQWVPWDEAVNHLSTAYIGLSELIGQDCYGEPNCSQSTYGKALSDWLDFYKKIDPAKHGAIVQMGENIEFILIDKELAYYPSDEPKSNIDFKEILKAAVFLPENNGFNRVLVSIPAIEQMGSLKNGLSVQQNKGWILFHELLNAGYQNLRGMENFATIIADIGESILRAYYRIWDRFTFIKNLRLRDRYYLNMNEDPLFLFEEISMLDKANLYNSNTEFVTDHCVALAGVIGHHKKLQNISSLTPLEVGNLYGMFWAYHPYPAPPIVMGAHDYRPSTWDWAEPEFFKIAVESFPDSCDYPLNARNSFDYDLVYKLSDYLHKTQMAQTYKDLIRAAAQYLEKECDARLPKGYKCHSDILYRPDASGYTQHSAKLKQGYYFSIGGQGFGEIVYLKYQYKTKYEMVVERYFEVNSKDLSVTKKQIDPQNIFYFRIEKR